MQRHHLSTNGAIVNMMHIKKLIVSTAIIIVSALTANAEAQPLFGEMLFLDKYVTENSRIKADGLQPCVVLIGDSIFAIWKELSPSFFTSNNYLCRGIGGNTSPQVLMRFRPDVIELHPRIVVIGIGTNDIAGGAGPYDMNYTLGNICSCAELAEANGIHVILSSVLPAVAFGWNPAVEDVPGQIDVLNAAIKSYAAKHGFGYVDFNTALRKRDGLARRYDSSDGVHPNLKAYKVMEELVEAEIERILRKTTAPVTKIEKH
ncbi:MAG: capsular biosynthesis protein [Alistipes sp.]|nr:capsular biosynthesis protein [Alistipes sp.]MDY4569776.1 GDSL-type esterase/lipase family protein [Alistipes senegalensis]